MTGVQTCALPILAHEEDPDADEQQHREPRHEDVHEERELLLGLGLDLDAVLEQVGDHPEVAGRVAVDELPFLGKIGRASCRERV